MSNANMPYARELDAAIEAVVEAGAVVRDLYDRSAAATYEKSDGSPVTDADLAADRVIREVLGRRFPGDAILTEEGRDTSDRLSKSRCWIVDPVDGTEQFILRTGEFDVLVALIENERPVAVAGFQPVAETLVYATFGGGAWVQVSSATPRRVKYRPVDGQPRLATSRWFGAPGNARILGSVARRLGISPGEVVNTGFSPRMFLEPRQFDVMIGVRDEENQTMASEWDFAVADLIIGEAGGVTTDLQGRPYRYNKPVPTNDGGLIAATDPTTHERVLSAIQSVPGIGDAA